MPKGKGTCKSVNNCYAQCASGGQSVDECNCTCTMSLDPSLSITLLKENGCYVARCPGKCGATGSPPCNAASPSSAVSTRRSATQIDGDLRGAGTQTGSGSDKGCSASCVAGPRPVRRCARTLSWPSRRTPKRASENAGRVRYRQSRSRPRSSCAARCTLACKLKRSCGRRSSIRERLFRRQPRNAANTYLGHPSSPPPRHQRGSADERIRCCLFEHPAAHCVVRHGEPRVGGAVPVGARDRRLVFSTSVHAAAHEGPPK